MNINSLGTSTPAPASFATPAPQQSAPQQVQQNRALSQAVRIVNDSSLTPPDRQLSLSLDPLTKIAVARIVDPTTGQVLNQLPTKDVLELAAYLEAQNAEARAQETHA